MTVLFEKRSDGVATVTLNRPEVLNALDSVAKQALADTILSRKIATLHSLEPSLEDVFLNVTGRGLM